MPASFAKPLLSVRGGIRSVAILCLDNGHLSTLLMGIGQISLSCENIVLGVLRLPRRELSDGGGTMWKLEVWVHSNGL